MNIKTALARPIAKLLTRKIKSWKKDPHKYQEKVFWHLIKTAEHTAFGKDHKFSTIKSYDDFKRLVPIRDYEGLKPYVDRVVTGEKDVLWKGVPKYLAETSGTTSGTKFISLSDEGLSWFVKGGRLVLSSYVVESGNAEFFKTGMIFISASHILGEVGGIPSGRLMAITYLHFPKYLIKNRIPSPKVNALKNWEEKVDKISDEALASNMGLVTGLPPWILWYFEHLTKKAGKKTVKEVFPDFKVMFYGGVNFGPYKKQFEEIIGGDIDIVENYGASEGFIAFQDSMVEKGMLLIVDGGIFYEFVPANEIHNENPTRLSLKEVEVGVNYAIIINTCSGMWGYHLGDTIQFVSTDPYKIIVTGRTKHFTSAFNEHVIADEVDGSISAAIKEFDISVVEYTVAPKVKPEQGLPHHEWFIEFGKAPDNLEAFAARLDELLGGRNTYYSDLRKVNILECLKIHSMPKDSFRAYMKSKGKLGGQFKMQRLANDRSIADELVSDFLPAEKGGKSE